MGRRIGLAAAPALPPDAVELLRRLVGEMAEVVTAEPTPALRIVRDSLTRRQLDVLRLMANGRSTTDTARLLGIGDQTVKFHKRTIYKTLGVDNATHAVAVALREGMIE